MTDVQQEDEYVDFSEAFKALKSGKRVGRSEWGGEEGLFLYIVPSSDFIVNRSPLSEIFPEGQEVNYASHIDICSPHGNCGVWTPSVYDMMQSDWIIINNISLSNK